MSRRRNFSPWAHWQLDLATTVPEDPPPSAPNEVGAWRERVRGRLEHLLGPMPARVPLDLEVTDTEETDAYKRERVVFDVDPAMSVPAFLLTPHTRHRPGPAVLAVHGHGPGKDEVCGLSGDQGAYAHELASVGYVVLAPDLRCFGERLDPEELGKYACDLNLVHAYAAGVNPLAQNLWDLMRCLDVLAAHPLVDADRMGVVGFSYGGTMALFLAATDERVRAAVVSGYLSSWKAAHRVPWNLCGSQVLPGMLGQLEHVDVGALIAPRALHVESGDDDVLFPAAVARTTVDQLRDVYRALGANPEAVEHAVYDGEHQWFGTGVADFLGRHLH